MLMKPKPGQPAGRRGGDPEAVAIAVFDRLVAEPERLGRFMALSGLSPDSIRGAAGSAGFLPAVLDHVCSDEALLIEIAGELEVDPGAVARARAELSPEWDPDA